MPRAVWNGTISFGLVTVPVQLYSATEQKDIHFHQLSPKGHRIKYKRVDEETGREVDYADIQKGYEVSKGKFVLLSPEELEAADPQRSRTIDVEDFVAIEEIDPIYFESTYYIAPRKGAEKPYALLRDTMGDTGRVAIGRFVMRTKEYLVALRAVDNMLVLHTMYFPDEIRDPKTLDVPSKRTKASERELKMAEQLVESLTTAFDPKKYKDAHREKVLELIKRKGKGEEIEVGARPKDDGKVVELFEALQSSLESAKKPRRSSTRRSTARRKKAS